MKAREVFKDCEYAKKRLQQAVDQKRLKDAKLLWFAALALLRAIGHVLHKVDTKTYGASFSSELEKRFNLWKEEPIFTDFIERERNNILKEYKSNLSEHETIEEGFILLESGDLLLTESGDAFFDFLSVTTIIKGSGLYSGTSPVIALSNALEWWDKELSELEQYSVDSE